MQGIAAEPLNAVTAESAMFGREALYAATGTPLAAPPDFVPFPRAALTGSIGARFAEQARRHPQRVAIRCEGNSLSYADLELRSSRIAGRILARCGADNAPVGVLVAQGPLLIASILGCLRANKIYAALDATLPSRQLRAMADDAGLQCIVTDEVHHEVARSLSASRPPLPVDADDGPCAANPRLDVAADASAYIFYTSGSTGRPKGVVDTHANVLHNVLRYTNTLCISASDRLTLLQAASFSGAVSSMFGALLNGATLCLWDMRKSGLAGLAAWLAHEHVTVYHSVPSIFREVAVSGLRFPSLRVIRLEGDQAAHRDAALFIHAFDRRCVLVNGLGATECGLVRQFFVQRGTDVPEGPLPIGYAVPDMDVAIVDENGVPVEPGAVGEIAVTSAYLASGYWRRPDLTAAAFRASGHDGARTYRTGDLGRMAADGCITHLGRKDFQHKIGGRQIDIGGVEAALLRLPGVRHAAARTHLREASGPILCGYVVGEFGQELPDWRRALQGLLPDWSIPSEISVLAALPLDANGKVDRKALPPPRATPSTIAPARPRTPLEAAIGGLWASILEVPEIDLHADFFAAGGDSLRAMRLVAAIGDVLGITLPVSSIFERENTVAAMARRIAALRDTQRSGG
jgi:amino acid adenylation domain-containing protein